MAGEKNQGGGPAADPALLSQVARMGGALRGAVDDLELGLACHKALRDIFLAKASSALGGGSGLEGLARINGMSQALVAQGPLQDDDAEKAHKHARTWAACIVKVVSDAKGELGYSALAELGEGAAGACAAAVPWLGEPAQRALGELCASHAGNKSVAVEHAIASLELIACGGLPSAFVPIETLCHAVAAASDTLALPPKSAGEGPAARRALARALPAARAARVLQGLFTAGYIDKHMPKGEAARAMPAEEQARVRPLLLAMATLMYTLAESLEYAKEAEWIGPAEAGEEAAALRHLTRLLWARAPPYSHGAGGEGDWGGEMADELEGEPFKRAERILKRVLASGTGISAVGGGAEESSEGAGSIRGIFRSTPQQREAAKLKYEAHVARLATRQAGTVEAEAMAVRVAVDQAKKRICFNCEGAMPKGTHTCQGCRIARYCDNKCREDHWAEHKPFCEEARGDLGRDVDAVLQTHGFQ